jgi:GST-like protein
MIDLYTAATPNGRKPVIMLEELELPYKLFALDLKQGEQHKPEYVAINPNGRIPAIVDHGAAGAPGGQLAVFESGAILIYLAEKTGKLLAPSGAARYEALEWVMFQMSAVGPMFGQYFHFTTAAPEKLPYAIERYRKEALRIFGVLEGRLAEHEYLAGEYSIADICTYPWVAGVIDRLEDTAGLTQVRAWAKRVGERSAVAKAMKIP